MKKLLAAVIALMMVMASAAFAEGTTGVEDGVLTVAME